MQKLLILCNFDFSFQYYQETIEQCVKRTRKWDKAYNCRDMVYKLELVG